MNNTDQNAPTVIDTGQQTFSVEWAEIDRLIPYERNAKTHSKEQISNVAKSIGKYGWKQPIVVDSDYVIVIGHCRYLAAKELALESVPVVVARDLTKEQSAELRIIDNKSNESPWDNEMLAVELPGIDLSLFDFQFNLDDVALPVAEPDEEYIDDFFDRGVQASEKPTVYAIKLTFKSEEEVQEALAVLLEMGYSATRV